MYGIIFVRMMLFIIRCMTVTTLASDATHCTRPVAEGEDPRAGRWASIEKTECGLHK